MDSHRIQPSALARTGGPQSKADRRSLARLGLRMRATFPGAAEPCRPARGSSTGSPGGQHALNQSAVARLLGEPPRKRGNYRVFARLLPAAAAGLLLTLTTPAVAAASASCGGYAAHAGRINSTMLDDSMRGYRAAHAIGADWYETDISVTKDGRFIIMHGPDLDRTSNGTGLIKNRTSGYISRHRLDDGTRIPTFERWLRYVGRTGVSAFVEIKDYNLTSANLRTITSTIKRFGLRKRIVVMSFDLRAVARIHRHYPGFRTATLTLWGPTQMLTPSKVLRYGNRAVVAESVTQQEVQAMRAAHIAVYVWTPETPDAWTKYRSWGVSRVMTDESLSYERWQAAGCTP